MTIDFSKYATVILKFKMQGYSCKPDKYLVPAECQNQYEAM